MIDLYFWPTPNGKKVTIQLEEAASPTPSNRSISDAAIS